MRTFRIVLWLLVVVAALGATLLWFNRPGPTGGQAWYAEPFELVDQNGAAVTQANYLGKPSAWFYGFTHCPDVCPTALAEMTAILEALGPDADKLNVIFVSVDPERDTPEIMKDYVEYFDPRIVGLTGDLAEVSAMANDPPPLNGSTLKYGFDHEGGPRWQPSDTSPKRSSRSFGRLRFCAARAWRWRMLFARSAFPS